MVQVVITTSGLGSRLGDITKYINKGMIKIGDKFVLDYVIDSYINQEDIEFVFTIGYKGDYIKQYIDLIYGGKMKYTFININPYEGDGSSLGYSLLQTKDIIKGPFYFHCNDSIIYEKIDIKSITDNTLFVTTSNDSTQYCSVNVNSNHKIGRINYKGEKTYDYIYIGVAYITDYEFFFKLLENEYNSDPSNASLNDVVIYKKMLAEKTFTYKYVNKYCDTGNNQQLTNAKQIFSSKYEVLDKLTETISFVDNKVAKFFVDKATNLSRVERTKYMPSHLLPRIHNYSDNFFIMSNEDGTPLSKIYHENMIVDLLNYMFTNFWVKTYSDDTFNEKCFHFYNTKTLDRIQMSLKSNLATDYHIINKCNVGDIMSLMQRVDFAYLTDGKPTTFHGDFILENILIKKDGTYCLVDWRQDFQGSVVYGDMYYDLAKLRHNLQLNHYNVENNLFNITDISTEDKECVLDMKCNYYLMCELHAFDRDIEARGLNLKKIKMLNSLIWINMSPLHSYPLSNFLFNLGKYSLHKILCEE
jgi:NDP-sugar pyrophosphorylase family protein